MVNWRRWFDEAFTVNRDEPITQEEITRPQVLKAVEEPVGAVQLAMEDLARSQRYRHSKVHDFGKGWLVAITDTGEQFHMWIDNIDLEDGAVVVNGVMRPVTDISHQVIAYEVYGKDGTVLARRPGRTLFSPDDAEGNVQNMTVRWLIQEDET